MAQKRSKDSSITSGDGALSGKGRTPAQYSLSADIIREALRKSGLLVTFHLQKTILAENTDGANRGFLDLMRSIQAINLPPEHTPALIWIVEDEKELKAVIVYIKNTASDLFDWMNRYTLVVVIKPTAEIAAFIQDNPIKRQALTASTASAYTQPSPLEAYVHFAPPSHDWSGGAVGERLDALPSDMEKLVQLSVGAHGAEIRRSGSASDSQKKDQLEKRCASLVKLEDLIGT